MLSRTILRSLPRSASRIARFSTQTPLLRPAITSTSRQTISSPLKLNLYRAAFSTTSAQRDDVGQELAAKLSSEISLEQEDGQNSTGSDENSRTFLDQNDFWALEDKEGSQDVVLRRQYDDETITISFSIVDFNSPSVMDEGEDDAFLDEEDMDGQSGGANTKGAVNQGRTSAGNVKVAPEDSIAPADREELKNDEDDYDGQQAFPANVNVLVQRSGRGAMRINLVADSGRFTIHGVTHLPESSASPEDQLHDTPDNLYTGPPFQQLDEEVQGLLEQYLDVRGINTALANFIPDYIDVKEQREYLRWLGRVRDFVE